MAIGLLIGTALFFMPKFIIGLTILFLLIRLVKGKRTGRAGFGADRLAFVDKVRAMDEEEYLAFKTNMGKGQCGRFSETRNSQ